jgi:hypothetical protein
MKFEIVMEKGYKGQCHCGKDAVHKQWCEFDTPVPAMPQFGFPEQKGIWNYVCEAHYEPDAIHTKEELRARHPELFKEGK